MRRKRAGLHDRMHEESSGRSPKRELSAAGDQPLGPPGASAPCRGFHLAWPTEEDVRGSMVGWQNGRALPATHKNVSKAFLEVHLSHWDSRHCNRQRLTPHMKSYCRCVVNQC
jgi:hypothetical protein